MARQEQDREDLLREATALVERAELNVPGLADGVVIGFRRDGAGSLFVGVDPVYQFNSFHQLRRAFRAGRLLKAEQGRLIELTRQRGVRQLSLLRRELTNQQTAILLTEFTEVRAQLQVALSTNAYQLVGQSPSDHDILPRITNWLVQLPKQPTIANQPNVK